MNSKRTFVGLLAANVVLVLVLFAGAYGIHSLLVDQKHKLVEKKTTLTALEAQNNGLKKAKKDIVNYSELGKIAKAVVPQDKDQAQTVRELVLIASRNGIKLSSITFPNSTLGSTTTPGTPSVGNLALSQLTPVKGLNGVYSLEIVVQSDKASPVSYDRFIGFLQALENNRRTALVRTISLSPDTKDSSKLSFTLTLDEYIKP